MARALTTFTVRAQRQQLGVRVLPSVTDVDREYHGGARRRRGWETHAFFVGASVQSRMLGVIVLNGEKLTHELIAHECTHAAIHAEWRIGPQLEVVLDSDAEERVATLVGMLHDRVVRGLRRWLPGVI